MEAVVCGYIRRFPRLSGPGPSRSHFEHWGTLAAHPEGLRAAGVVLVRLLFRAFPENAAHFHLGGGLLALKKGNGGIRPLAWGGVLQRLVGKAVCKVEKERLRAAGGPRQYGISRSAGVEKMHKLLTVLAEARPRHAFLAFDAANAFNTIYRSSVRQAVAGPPLGTVASNWYQGSTRHWFWDAQGKAWPVDSARGLDQGCPLSPGLFSAALAPQLDKLLASLRGVDGSAEVFAYLDDVFVVIDAAKAAEAAQMAGTALAEVGLQLRPDKTKVWVPDAGVPLPRSSPRRVEQMGCLGNTLPFTQAVDQLTADAQGLDEPDGGATDVPIAVGTAFAPATEAFKCFLGQLRSLMQSGLRKQTAWSIASNYANGGANHFLRGCWADAAWCDEFDACTVTFLEELLGVTLAADQRDQL